MTIEGPALRQQFILGMSHAAATVNIVTTDGPAGRAGVTVSAMSSVSADTPKPTLLVCVHHLAAAAAKILENGVFCVNVLRDDQSYIADTFAGRFKDQVADKFDCAEWLPMSTGAPRVVDPLAGFDCRIVSSNLVGTHYVFFGEVQEMFVGERGSPLIYAHRAYGSPSRIEAAGSIGAGREAKAKRLAIGCFHTFGPYVLPEMIAKLRAAGEDAELHLVEGDQRRVQESLLAGEVELALLYGLGLAPGIDAAPLIELKPYVLLAAGHPLARHTRLTPEQLRGEPMVLLNAPPSREYFTSILTDAGVEPVIAYRSSSFEMVRGMVGHGLGYALLATEPVPAMSYDGKPLAVRPLVSAAKPSRVVLARRRGVALSPAAERLAAFAGQHFASSRP